MTSIAFAQNFSKVEKHTLPNGLEVYINEDHSSPAVFGAVIVKAGSKHDPKDATGIAHYFEHIMFKGTDKIGTTDYAAEKVYLDSIMEQYDVLGTQINDEDRKKTQAKINDLSIKASAYAIPNEIDNILKAYGATGLNAYTSFEQTVYHNSFPSNQIERWIDIYSERFQNPVFRLFQSELETIYEEKNISIDNVFRQMMEVFLKNAIPNHPYGQQTTLGSVEHLKNPNLRKMMEFYNTYYVANNMALILCGDVYPDQIMPIIEQKFGVWKSGTIPEYPKYEQPAFDKKNIVEVKMTPVAMSLLAFQTVPNTHPDRLPLELFSDLLSNSSSTGALDKITLDNHAMMVQNMPMTLNDLGLDVILCVPKLVGQSFDNAESYVFAALDSLRAGQFDEEWLNELKLQKNKEFQLSLEDVSKRSMLLVSAITSGISWDEILKTPELINSLNKADMVRLANQYFDKEHVFRLHSRMGFPSKTKVEKPGFAPIPPQNTNAKSAYAKYLETLPEKSIEPKFIDFKKDIQIYDLQNSVHVYQTPNPDNQIFTLDLYYGIGELGDSMLPHLAGFMSMLGANGEDFNTFKRKLQKIGTSVDFSCENHYFVVKMDGFDNQLEASLKLLNDLLTKPTPDDTKVAKLAEFAESNYKMAIEDPATMGEVLLQYVMQGDDSKYLKTPGIKAIKKLKSATLFEHLKKALSYEADVLYCGTHSQEELSKYLKEYGVFAQNPQAAFARKPYPIKNRYDKPQVFVINDKKAVQTQIYLFQNGDLLPQKELSLSKAFNQYFGTGMSSLIFQEVREFRSLAYGAYGVYQSSTSHPLNTEGATVGWLQTQTDKTVEALNVVSDIFRNMPEKREKVSIIQNSLKQDMLTKSPNFRQLGGRVSLWVNQGFTEDPRKSDMDIYEHLTFENIQDFYKKHVQNKATVYALYGNIKAIDEKQLKNFGKITTLKTKDIIRK